MGAGSAMAQIDPRFARVVRRASPWRGGTTRVSGSFFQASDVHTGRVHVPEVDARQRSPGMPVASVTLIRGRSTPFAACLYVPTPLRWVE